MKLNISAESLELKSWAMIRVTPPKADVKTVDFCFLVYIPTVVCILRTEAVILSHCIHRYFLSWTCQMQYFTHEIKFYHCYGRIIFKEYNIIWLSSSNRCVNKGNWSWLRNSVTVHPLFMNYTFISGLHFEGVFYKLRT